jgi:hypothetical protein
MSSLDVKGDLHTYLRGARETLVWKLDGLGEYDIRRPLTPDRHEPARPRQAQRGYGSHVLR